MLMDFLALAGSFLVLLGIGIVVGNWFEDLGWRRFDRKHLAECRERHCVACDIARLDPKLC